MKKEKSAVVARERFDSDGDYESCILDLDSGEELCDWYTWIGSFGDSEWGIVMHKEERKDRFNFINLRGKIMTPDKWYEKTEPFISGEGRVSTGDNIYTIDTTGKLTKEP